MIVITSQVAVPSVNLLLQIQPVNAFTKGGGRAVERLLCVLISTLAIVNPLTSPFIPVSKVAGIVKGTRQHHVTATITVGDVPSVKSRPLIQPVNVNIKAGGPVVVT